MTDIEKTPERPVRDEAYAAQREELTTLLKDHSSRNRPLVVHGRPLLTADDMSLILSKIKNSHHFSRKELFALTEAGFHLDRLYPDLT